MIKRNSLKIVCNPYTNNVSYYFMNEQGVWVVMSESSPLSRKFYTDTTISERAKEILKKADEIYNRKNKGLDILFEGTSENYEILRTTLKELFPERDIVCSLGITKIAVVGKKSVGKSSLIEGMEDIQGYKYDVKEYPDYYVYSDEGNHAEWYEIKGIDLGLENVEKAYNVISELTQDGLSVVVYCVGATTGRMEDVEKDFLLKITNNYPKITALVAITMWIKTDIRDFVDEIEKMTDQIKVVTTLAKPYEIEVDNPNTGEKKVTLPPCGLQVLSKYVFERR
jgi:hypothetical protein